MKLELSPFGVEHYRQVTKTGPQRSPTRRCQGQCNRSRSIAQFDGDSKLCKQCVRRIPK